MTNGITLHLNNPVQAYKEIKEVVWPWVKAMLIAKHQLTLTVKPAKRTQAHSARLHAMLGWLSEHVQWGGAYRSTDEWKRLTVAAWSRAKGESIGYLPAIDGKGIDIVFLRTSEMSGRDMADLIEWIYFWGCSMEYDIPEVIRDPVTKQLVNVRRLPAPKAVDA
jgi:hypothetical protein